MKKTLYLVLSLVLSGVAAMAQNAGPINPTGNFKMAAPQPFLFSVNTLTGSSPYWSLNYSGSYGERTLTPFGYDGVDQQLAVKGYLGNQFTLYANAALGFARDGGTTSAQQAELMHDFIGGKQLFGPRIGLSLGGSRDWTNVKSIFSRVTASFDAASWRFAGNLRFEKAFDKSRDGIDLITSLGFHHRIIGNFYAGAEAVGEDLEGFWEADEAEGGAKLLIGPSVNYIPSGSRFGFSICGGPIIYATHSNVVPSEAVRDLSTLSQNGYTIRAQVSFNLH
ncbi:hypothetical protein [Mucilaginibacter sp. SG564]|uniref:hypothetical protein n=1 Tax=Mucilaginibacter sp. SG564 TaxID=2587022 RepID=UPI001556A2A8|nr:hypothetical protein [Mucilaginibacter sp. SG564]NOW93913.1 hypothetical protein [Mucilaginibacter sp. SG564]